MPVLEIALLRSFIEVSRSGSISSAARQVGRTQSAVSMQMNRLEAIVGQPILRRTRGGVELTAAGDRFLAQAERILAVHDEAIATLPGAGLHGLISFGCPEDYLTAFFPDLLKGFGARHGDVEIEVVCAPTTELHLLLQRRRIDLALISVPGEDTSTRILRPESFVWVANHPAPEILQKDIVPLALSAPDTLDHRAARTAMDQAGKAYRIAFASNGLAGLLAIARSGQAISVVTRSAVPPDLHIVETGLPPLPGIGVTLAYASPNPSAATQAFGEFVSDKLRSPSTA
ncbi:LysR family transcriptional regulator [Roseibium aggregatum]|uniref:LysR family transcriptional regulator n=1 Tax=Roseibium aggregatum TaxID=187304 RepID=UPI003A984ACC